MNLKGKEIFLGLVAISLLLIYASSLGNILFAVYTWNVQAGEFIINPNILWTVNIIGGLVSAVVIGNLALAGTGETPETQVREMIKAYGAGLMKAIVWTYLIIWFLVGAATFFVGVIKCPDVSEQLNTMGKSWLGILVGALYAWFGIKKS
jgi:hypothetical protein